ncbi:MAG: TolC family protein, partial [Acidobacteria bacterium]|nr:TolC family protein [Acidobacteriota bacterium]
FNPQYSSNWQAQFTQPLLRNRSIDQNRGTIKLANLDLKLNDSQFKQKVMDTVARIQGFYWDLIGAIRDYEIRRESVRLAQISLDNNRKKVDIGTLAPIAITEAQAELASREVDLIVAEERINTVENSLRNLISSDRNAEIWRQTIVPTETPEFKEYKVDLEQAISTALATRPELEQLSLRMEQNDLSYSLGNDRRKWQLDLVGQFGTVGAAGPQTLVNGIPQVPDSLVGGPLHSYSVMLTEGFYNWFVGVTIQIPLRNRAVDAQLAQYKVQNRQMLMNRRVLEQQIQTEIRNAVQTIETNKKRVETARVARELAREQLEGEEKRFQAGLSENFRVLDRQRGLSQAQGVELQALIAYKKSIIDLQKSMYTLLESNDFEIAKTSSENIANLK